MEENSCHKYNLLKAPSHTIYRVLTNQFKSTNITARTLAKDLTTHIRYSIKNLKNNVSIRIAAIAHTDNTKCW